MVSITINCHRIDSHRLSSQLSSTAIYCHLLPSTAIYCHLLPSTAIYCHQLSSRGCHHVGMMRASRVQSRAHTSAALISLGERATNSTESNLATNP